MPAQTLYAPVAPAGVLDVQLDSVNDANATDEKTIMYGAADGCTAPSECAGVRDCLLYASRCNQPGCCCQRAPLMLPPPLWYHMHSAA